MAGYGFNTGLDGHRIQPLTEKDAEEIAEGLKIIYGNARERMLTSVANRVSRGVTRYGWAERKASEVLAAHAQLERDIDRDARERGSLLSGVMDRAYMTGSQQFYTDMRSILGDTAHVSPNSQKTGYILADLNNSLNAAERRILRQFDDRYADIIGAISSEMATGVMNARQAVGEALQQFADQGITGFIDRGGHHWTLENYAEMAVLTAIERATVSGYVDTMQSYGFDLAVIDGHIGSCPICEAWEGVIVSVSGNDPNYPSLSDAENAGCFHPRCMHGIHTYYEGITHTPKDGFRDEPRPVRPASKQYTARSRQRYCERMAQKYRDRALVAQTPQQKAQANHKAREWSEEAKRQKSLQFSRTSGNIGLQQTGGKLPLWLDDKRQKERAVQAEAAYDAIRKADDIAAIARASGFSVDDIMTIKNHIFFESHALYDGYGTLSADYDIAVAWKRIADGHPLDRDITLLRHELAEAQAEKAGSLTLSQAHAAANTQYNWAEQLEKEKGEEGEDDGLLQTDQP